MTDMLQCIVVLSSTGFILETMSVILNWDYMSMELSHKESHKES